MLFEKINDYAKAIVTEIAKAVNIAQAMIADAELAAKAEATAERHTQCRNCQAGLTNWLIANPTACESLISTAHHDLWSECPACVAEYAEWSEECDRQAAEAELASFGSDYTEELNAHPFRFTGGVE